MCYYDIVEVLKKHHKINNQHFIKRNSRLGFFYFKLLIMLNRLGFIVNSLKQIKEVISLFDYYGGKWKKKRNTILRKDKYKCQIAKWFGRSEAANTVHHIYPAKDYPEYSWCDWNLISVSNASHNKLENRKTGELTALGRWLMQKTKPRIDWRK